MAITLRLTVFQLCYHVSLHWLKPNAYHAGIEVSIEVGNAKAFLKWTPGHPWMVLHKLTGVAAQPASSLIRSHPHFSR